MSNDIYTTTQEPQLTTTIAPSNDLLEYNTTFFNKLKDIFLFLISRFFLMSFGIFIGAGIVVKFSPETKNLKIQIEQLKEENKKLKIMIDTPNRNVDWGNIKDSIILKK